VRIHLDIVEQLGTFLEFEAVLAAQQSEAEGQRQLAALMSSFELRDEMLIAVSYSDLLLERATASHRAP
jgi:adenylate cyclase class IV